MDLNDILKDPKQIQQLIKTLQALVPGDTKDSASEEAEDEPEEFNNKMIKTKTTKRKRSSSDTNKFLKMAEKNLHKEDAKIDKLLSVSPPVARMREFEMIDVTCRVCGKKETISPGLLISDSPSRYKCNTCSTSAG
jgi:hypothetical protein